MTRDGLLEQLQEAGLEPRPCSDSDAVLLPNGTNVAELPVFRDGLCQPQDATSQRALGLAPPRPGQLVLDLCAGAGTKTTQAAELMNNEGVIIATDRNVAQLDRIAENAARLGVDIIQTTPVEQLDRRLASVGRPPDLILVDVPCSNTGVLARRPEARYRASHRALQELVQIQRTILQDAARRAGPQTRLVYTTCSLEREENEEQAEWFLAHHAGWARAEQAFTTPDRDRDGGFASVLVRSASQA